MYFAGEVALSVLFSSSRKRIISSLVFLAHVADHWSVCTLQNWPYRARSQFWLFYFNSTTCHWIKQLSPRAWSGIPILPLVTAQNAGLESGSLLHPALHLHLPRWVFSSLASHAKGKWQHFRWWQLLSWPYPVPDCLEFEYQDSAKQEVNSSLECVRNSLKTRHEQLECSGCLGWCLTNLQVYGVVRQKLGRLDHCLAHSRMFLPLTTPLQGLIW